jgi:hypothetical protein
MILGLLDLPVRSLGTLAVFASPSRPALDPDEPLQYPAWWAYLGLALAYTFLIFRYEFKGQTAFSRTNGYSVSKVLAIHATYLVTFLCVVRIAGYLVFYLPRWMTNTFGAGRHVQMSITDLCVLLACAVFAVSEQSRLYPDAD